MHEFWQPLHDGSSSLHVERRFEPFFRPAVDAVFREPVANLIEYLINRPRRERVCTRRRTGAPRRGPALQTIIDTMDEYMRQHWPPGNFQGQATPRRTAWCAPT